MCAKIKNIVGREILDSRGFPTVEVDVLLSDGSCGRASVPSGASTGTMEALELRDGDSHRYLGRGVLQAINYVKTEIKGNLLDFDATQQSVIDQCLIDLDGTDNKSRLGSNTTLGVSLAVAKAAANSLQIPIYRYLGGVQASTLPIPMINIINGGAHADNALDFQEFMIIPCSAPSFKEALRMSAEVFHTLKKTLKRKGFSTNVGDEGGFAPNLTSTVEAIELLLESIELAGYTINKDFSLGLDVAASVFCHDGIYKFENQFFDSQGMVNYYLDLVSKYPISSIEDPMDEADHVGWQLMTEKLGDKIQIVGDDLFVTNCKQIEFGIKNKMANAVLIKPNQIGTVTETLAAVKLARENNYRTIISHRSGETEDCSITHIAVAINCGQIKTGSLSRSDRLAKYNELLRIEEQLTIGAT